MGYFWRTTCFLQQDNARDHTARVTATTMQDLKFDCLQHTLYSPDFTPSHYFDFGQLKEALGRKKFLKILQKMLFSTYQHTV